MNKATFIELKDIFEIYGEEPLADKLALKVIQQRMLKKFESSQDLKDLILSEDNNHHKFKTIMRIFQALRVSVNNEIDNLRVLCEKVPKCLAKDGLAFFITFNSLEENIVLNSMKQLVACFFFEFIEF